VRNGFLIVVVGWLGWTVGVQLSIVNVMNYLRAPFINLDVGTYLAEPLMLIVAVYTLISVLLIGRGVFCGWLCPFGRCRNCLASLPAHCVCRNGIHRRPSKSACDGQVYRSRCRFGSGDDGDRPDGRDRRDRAVQDRDHLQVHPRLPFVLYAVALLAIGLFSERAYCRFLCPLGGFLAFLDRLHLLNLLKAPA